MATAERSIRFLLQDPDANEDTRKHFTETNCDDDDLAKLYRQTWVDRHLPIKRAKINRPTCRARCEEIRTPDECWVVETNVFAILQAPTTIMIRQENLDCFNDLIKEHAGECSEDLTTSISEASTTRANHIDTLAVFSNPFESRVLREENVNEGVIVTGQSGIGRISHSIHPCSTYTNRPRKKCPVASHTHPAPSRPPSHHMARRRYRSHTLYRRRCFRAFLC